MNKKIFVCSAFAGNEKENVKRASAYMKFVRKCNNIPFASHLLYPQIFSETTKDNREFGMKCSFSFIQSWADELWYFTENEVISDGMKAEIDYAKKLGIKVRHMNKLMRELQKPKFRILHFIKLMHEYDLLFRTRNGILQIYDETKDGKLVELIRIKKNEEQVNEPN